MTLAELMGGLGAGGAGYAMGAPGPQGGYGGYGMAPAGQGQPSNMQMAQAAFAQQPQFDPSRQRARMAYGAMAGAQPQGMGASAMATQGGYGMSGIGAAGPGGMSNMQMAQQAFGPQDASYQQGMASHQAAEARKQQLMSQGMPEEDAHRGAMQSYQQAMAPPQGGYGASGIGAAGPDQMSNPQMAQAAFAGGPQQTDPRLAGMDPRYGALQQALARQAMMNPQQGRGWNSLAGMAMGRMYGRR